MPVLPWWQVALLLLVSVLTLGGAATWFMLLRARLAGLVPAKPAGPPTPQNVSEGLADLLAVRAEWRAFKQEALAILEACDDLAETVERRRRRTASAAARAEKAAGGEHGEEPEQNTRIATLEQARAKARAMGVL